MHLIRSMGGVLLMRCLKLTSQPSVPSVLLSLVPSFPFFSALAICIWWKPVSVFKENNRSAVKALSKLNLCLNLYKRNMR